MLNAETSHQLWNQLQQLYTSQSLAKVLELKLLLQTSKKGSLICAQFIQQIQSITDRLCSVGSTISIQDLVIYTLQGLGSEYDNFVTTFSMRTNSPSMTELQSLLLAHETRVQASVKALTNLSAHLTSSASAQTGANNTSFQQSEALYTATKPFNKNNQGQFHHSNQKSYSYRGRGGYRGRGRGRETNNDSSGEANSC
jgi:gag-polypeptide of LTR copia-type